MFRIVSRITFPCYIFRQVELTLKLLVLMKTHGIVVNCRLVSLNMQKISTVFPSNDEDVMRFLSGSLFSLVALSLLLLFVILCNTFQPSIECNGGFGFGSFLFPLCIALAVVFHLVLRFFLFDLL